MTLYEIIIISIALAMDAFTIAVACGLCMPEVTKRHTFRLAFHFGLFQALMPVIGWAAGLTVKAMVETYAPWISFVLLSFVGGKMIYDSFQQDESCDTKKDPTKGFSLIFLSIATSLDALAVGLSFSIMNYPIAMPSVLIGITAFVLTAIGMQIGKKFSKASRYSHIAELVGGIILILIGLKLLLQ
ncbi:manganese efflux pump MntP family protein [Maridesulfovibrio ferrireducens]|uniref:manganese efflux pump MntP n=1 Tax=Maridesulfovibrio ferrireducens TaxID=246191 RepID=UPI001A1D3AEF|nr:manganese efflux pump MntP family protein [Maridesulfovibrio ferrireducens]MBI9110592.1 manganese efflux pump [Maridesulfovibrio ferrireducens]